METVTLYSEDFKTIHNTLCELRSLTQRMEHSMIKIEDVQRIIESFEQGLENCYQQERETSDSKTRHYDSIKQDLELKHSEWSVYEVEDLNQRHAFEGATTLMYKDHWGDMPAITAINGLTWCALWVAADACIRDSGDGHHVYVEGFRRDRNDPSTLVLSTGS